MAKIAADQIGDDVHLGTQTQPNKECTHEGNRGFSTDQKQTNSNGGTSEEQSRHARGKEPIQQVTGSYPANQHSSAHNGGTKPQFGRLYRPNPASQPSNNVHASEVQPHQAPPPPNTGNPKLDQNYQQQQTKLIAKQNQEHQQLQQQQEAEHQRAQQQNASEAQKQQMEQRHQQQTQQMEQHHTQQQQQLTQRQPASHTEERPK
jgi:hypothetical protein